MGLRGQRHVPDSLPQGNKPCTHFTRNWVGQRRAVWTGAEIFAPSSGLSKCVIPFNYTIPETRNSVHVVLFFNFATGQHDITEIIIPILPLKPKFLHIEKKTSKCCDNKISAEGTARRGIF